MASKTSAIPQYRPLVMLGPSGSGKSTLLHKIICEYPDKFGFSVSHTTRKPRDGEINGKHYHFTTIDNMKKAIAEGKFIETAQYNGNWYGTSKESVNNIVKEGKLCVMDVDVNGVRQIKNSDLNPWYIFIKPPSLEALEARLRSRKTESEESLKKRLQIANEEMEYGLQSGNVDKIIVNDVLEHAYEELKQFVFANIFEAPQMK